MRTIKQGKLMAGLITRFDEDEGKYSKECSAGEFVEVAKQEDQESDSQTSSWMLCEPASFLHHPHLFHSSQCILEVWLVPSVWDRGWLQSE